VRRVLIDTSAFIEFFRGRRVPALESALRSNAALLSAYVRLELLQGVRKSEARELSSLLAGIPQVPHDEAVFPTAEAMLTKLKGTGINVGVVDLLIAAQARLWNCYLLSFDAVFLSLEKHGLVKTIRSSNRSE
jgi:predicted nucleic acid-binding protein